MSPVSAAMRQHIALRFLIAYVQSDLPDLTNRQMAIIQLVALTEGPHTVRALAAALNVSKPVITRALNSFEILGFLRRVRDQQDRRNIFIELRPEGREFLDKVEALRG